MKKGNGNLKLVGGLLAGMIIGGATVVGANQAIQALQNTEIKVSLNGQVQTFKDETTGEVQFPITYHNRTFLPLRNVAQLAGLDVDYDNGTNTAVLKGNKKLEIYDGDYKLNEYLIFKNKYLLSFCKSHDNGGVESTLIITGDNIEEKEFDVSVYESKFNGASSMQEMEDSDNSQDGEFMYEIKDNKILLTKYVPDGSTNGGLTNLVRVDYEIVEENGVFTENIISINMDDCRNTAATGYTSELLNYVKNNSDKVINNNTPDVEKVEDYSTSQNIADNKEDISNGKEIVYEELTPELNEGKVLFVNKVIDKDNSYELQGLLFEDYIISQEEMNSILADGTVVFDGIVYNIREHSSEYDNFANLMYDLFEDGAQYPLYCFVKNNDEYELKRAAQIDYCYKSTGKYVTITVEKNTPFEENYGIGDEPIATVEKEFDNYIPRKLRDNDTYPIPNYKFEFTNGICTLVRADNGI